MLAGGMPRQDVERMVQLYAAKVTQVSCASCGMKTHETQHCFVPVIIKAICRSNTEIGKNWKLGKLAKAEADIAKRHEAQRAQQDALTKLKMDYLKKQV